MKRVGEEGEGRGWGEQRPVVGTSPKYGKQLKSASHTHNFLGSWTV